MSEEITNTVETASPVTDTTVTDQNTVANQEPQTVDVQQPEQQVQQTEDNGTVENSNQEVVDQQQDTQVQQPTIEELQNRLREYELRDEEDMMIRQRLGIGNVDQQTYNYMNLDQQVVNIGKQEYLRLCNEYGVDANPNNIDKSIETLKTSDPAKAYEFQRQFERLSDDVVGRRNAIRQQNNYYEISKFGNEYGELLNASPALNNIMGQYVTAYGDNSSGMYQQLHDVMDIVLPAYREAFNAGKQYALQDKARRDTSGVQGGIATANTQTYTPGGTFTREQIKKMSTEEFTKYEKDIMQQMREGKII